MTKRIKVKDIGLNPPGQLLHLAAEELMTLPNLQDELKASPPVRPLTEEQKVKYECSLDGVSAVHLTRPQSKEEEDRLVASFLSGLKKLLSKEDNWTFLQPLTLSLDYCAKCLACSEECPIYIASGKQDIYRPSYRSEVLRRIIHRYLKKGGEAFAKLAGNDVELNWTTIARLAESAYRCTLCRRCAQTCVRGVDNGLIAHELRKVFSQEMGIAAKELHELGTVQQLEVGASTGLRPKALEGIIQFMEEEIGEKTGKKIRIPVDKRGADILLIHNTGEYMSWPENPEAFAIIFEAAGVSWTLSSELGGYEATNYGLWYDDVQLAKIALKQAQVAKDLRVRKIVIGECGHAHKAAIVTADRVFPPELNIPRESCMPVLEEIVLSGKLKLDPHRNNFPVTLHDPCNMVRSMGIVEPQRRILRAICPQFREMEPHGVENYCCGGGSGFAIMNSMNFPDWKLSVSGRMKVKQIIDAFEDVLDPHFGKYVCAPCSNCKGQLRDLISYYNLEGQYNIAYGGLVELIVNAMVDMPVRFLEVEEVPAVEEVPVRDEEALV
ncbi:(Fe-S)-binding protein [Chloroflexota bacterium]